jgi:hypothetical protein
LVESLDDFAELVLHVHPDRLKKLSEHLAFPSEQGLAQQLLYCSIDIEFKEKYLKGGN